MSGIYVRVTRSCDECGLPTTSLPTTPVSDGINVRRGVTAIICYTCNEGLKMDRHEYLCYRKDKHLPCLLREHHPLCNECGEELCLTPIESGGRCLLLKNHTSPHFDWTFGQTGNLGQTVRTGEGGASSG